MMRPITPKTLTLYTEPSGKQPFAAWIEKIRDPKAYSRISIRLRLLEQGHYGDVKPVGGGVYELRLFFGPGYRIYFAENRGQTVLLLCGGDKSTQARDIETAQHYWKLYQESQ